MLLRHVTAAMVLFWTCALAPAWDLMLTSKEQENQLGEETYQQVLKEEKVSRDKVIVDYVQRVAQRITAVAPDMGFKYEVAVLESDKINAFCLPGGKICVYTAILPFCQNEAGLATVVGHEVAHAILRHGGKRMTQSTVVQFGGFGLGQLLKWKGVSSGTSDVAMAAYGYGSQLGILLPYSRGHEVEADHEGLLYMAKAGYDPREAPEFWKRFSVLKSDVPTFMSTHPSHEDREGRLEQSLAEAQKLYANSAKLGLGARVPEAYLKAVAGKPATGTTAAGTTTATQPTKPPVEPSKTGTAVTEKKTSDFPFKIPDILRPAAELAEPEIRRGLQEALSKGFRSALTELGKQDGFFLDKVVKVVMPEELGRLDQLVRAMGKGQMVDDFVLQMNRAAERAVPATSDILAQAVASLTIQDAKAILNGKEDEATQYFQKTCHANLVEKIKPLVTQATAAAGATKAYKGLLKKVGPLASFAFGGFDLDSYVTEKAVGGLYVKMADEEKRIRANPGGQASDILRRVFGSRKK